MPEGPSIVILRESVEALHLKRKKILQATGTADIDMDQLQGQSIQDFRSWGKQFLICFKHFTVSIHFMLFGSWRINERSKGKPRLSLLIGEDELNFYACKVKRIDQPADALYDLRADIMSPEWDTKLAVRKLVQKPETLITDALLDQQIFAGSGNIIKNEVLFLQRVHPLSQVGNIPTKKLKEISDETSRYAFDFLHWKKEGTLKKHWLAYSKKTCPRCHIPFHKEYLGKGKRRTYYCDNCQKSYDEKISS